MNQETIELLKVLADKFGTTTEHLWSVLINQAFLSGLSNSAFLAVILIPSVWWIRYASREIRKEREHESYYSATSAETLRFIRILLILACVIAACILLHDIMTAFVNPEYWALREILKCK